MKKAVSLVVLLLLCSAAICMFIEQRTETTADGVEVDMTTLQKGEVAPEIQLQTTSGELFSLHALQGKKVVLNFWASWCPPCREEMPALQRYADQYGEAHNVEVVAVNLHAREQNKARVDQFIEQYRLTFTMPVDVDGEVDAAYRILTIPTTFMIDTNGRVQHEIKGPVDEAMLKEYVGKLE